MLQWPAGIPSRISRTSQHIERSNYFSKLNRVRAYYQILVVPSDVPKTAVITPFGLLEFVRMPFGLRNVAQTFQCFMDQVLRGLTFTYNYIDDLLIGSEDSEEHKNHLRIVFELLQVHGILIKLSKCELGIPQLLFLGHQIENQGIHPLPEKVQGVWSFSN